MRAHHCTSIPYFSTSIVANDLFLQKGTTREDSDCAVSSESAFLRLQPRIMIRTSVHAEDLTNFKRNADTADQPGSRKMDPLTEHTNVDIRLTLKTGSIHYYIPHYKWSKRAGNTLIRLRP